MLYDVQLIVQVWAKAYGLGSGLLPQEGSHCNG